MGKRERDPIRSSNSKGNSGLGYAKIRTRGDLKYEKTHDSRSIGGKYGLKRRSFGKFVNFSKWRRTHADRGSVPDYENQGIPVNRPLRNKVRIKHLHKM